MGVEGHVGTLDEPRQGLEPEVAHIVRGDGGRSGLGFVGLTCLKLGLRRALSLGPLELAGERLPRGS